MELLVLLLLALVAGIQAGPIDNPNTVAVCARTCTKTDKFDYTPGTTYEFQYDNEIRSSIQGESEHFSGLQLSAKVHMSFLSKCEFKMSLSDVSLEERDPETAMLTASPREFQTALERSPVTVSFQDGSVEELCLSGNDPTWVTNVKRGILSVFQNKMDDLKSKQKIKESDVSGHCDVEYTPGEVGWSNLVIKKSKSLLSCEGHQVFQSEIKGTPHRVPSEIQSMSLMKSEHECEQELSRSNGRLQSATCREFHMFRPFSREASGAITHNTQKLTFTRESRTPASPGRIAERVPLTFEHVSDAASTMRSRKDMERILVEVCETTATGVTPDTPRLFTNIVYILKKLEASDMDAVYQKVKSGALCAGNNARVSKMFLDAIPMAGTASSIHMMTQLITSKTVTGVKADMWLTTLAFIQKPTTDMLREIKPLLTMDDDKTMLGVSSLVNSFCRVNTGCESNLEVMKIIALLENKITPGCKVTESNFETVLLALRAIGNTGFATRATSTLNACMSLATNPMEIRLSAIEAYRRMPCSADKRQIMALFLNKEEDSEIRISAYKTLMECPSRDVLRQVKTALESEEVNQVGSYVWSHLTNLMETSDPHKQDIRAILENETLQKEFDLDKRKFSRNYERSVFLEKINTSAKAEGDIIWSSKSFIMRSAMLNLTVDMFGQPINLFEVGGRVEGLESALMSYFGPIGYFSDNGEKDPAQQTALSASRSGNVDSMNKRFEKMIHEPRGNFYMRMFGNELRYMNFRGFDSLLNNNRLNFLEMLMSLSQTNDYSFSQSVMFLDSSIIIPTSAGFPLNLTVNGTAMIDFKASGKMDLAKRTSTPRSLEISGMVHPSAVLEISSMMSVDAFVTKSGIRMVSTLNSDSSIQGKVQLSDGKIFSAEWDLPQKKIDIFSMRSTFFTIHRDVERERRVLPESRQDRKLCTRSKLAVLTGLELCGEFRFPNASSMKKTSSFPITDPLRTGASRHRRSTQNGYKFEAKLINTEDVRNLHVALTTPVSSGNLGFDVSLNKRDITMDMSFTSPWKKADFQASVTNQRSMIGIQGKLNVDGSIGYMVQAEVKAESSGAGTKYIPSIEIRGVAGNPLEASGSFLVKQGGIFDLDVTIMGLAEHPIVLKGWLHSPNVNAESFMTKAHGELDSNGQCFLVDVSLNSTRRSSLKIALNIQTPVNGYETIAATLNHSVITGSKSSRTVLSVEAKQVLAQLTFMSLIAKRSTDPSSYTLDFRVLLPFSNMGILQGKASLTTEQSRYESHAVVRLGTSSHELDIYISPNGWSTSLKISSNKPVEVMISCSWEPTDFRFHAEVNIGTNINDLDVVLNLKPAVKGRIRLRTPCVDNIDGKFYAIITESANVVQNQYRAAFSIGVKTFDIEHNMLDLKDDNVLKLEVAISSPFFSRIAVTSQIESYVKLKSEYITFGFEMFGISAEYIFIQSPLIKWSDVSDYWSNEVWPYQVDQWSPELSKSVKTENSYTAAIKTSMQDYERFQIQTVLERSFKNVSGLVNFFCNEENVNSFAYELLGVTIFEVLGVTKESLLVNLKLHVIDYSSELMMNITIAQSSSLHPFTLHTRFTANAPFTSPFILENYLHIDHRFIEYSFNLTSQMRNMEALKLKIKNKYDNFQIVSEFEASGAPSFVIGSQLKHSSESFHHSAFLTTPFEALRDLQTNIEVNGSSKLNNRHAMTVWYNHMPLLDFEAEL